MKGKRGGPGSSQNSSLVGNYLASDTDVIVAANIMTRFAYGDSFNNNDKQCECLMLTEDGGHEIDPTRLSYRFELFAFKSPPPPPLQRTNSLALEGVLLQDVESRNSYAWPSTQPRIQV